MRKGIIMGRKLRFGAVLSSLLALVCLAALAPAARAHEVQPAILDVQAEGDTLRLTFALTLESYLSGLDLDGLQDTNDAENAQAYDALRTLTPEALAAQVPDLVADWSALPLVRFDGVAAPLTFVRVEVPQVDNPDLLRTSDLVLTAPILGSQVQIAWPDGAGDVVIRQQGVAEPFTGYLSGGETSQPITLAGGDAPGGWATFAAYIPVGFDHILPKGLDHILFVLGLFLLSTRLGPLLWQVTAFTAAHTVTLALGALGLVNIPGSIVEPLIAASIVYVAVENIFTHRLNPWRPVIVFGFGLLHGLGFASVLGEFGLPEAQFVPALLGFNVGVEIGQLTVIALAALALWLGVQAARRTELDGMEETVTDYDVMFRAWSITGSIIIAVIAMYWVIERTLL